MFGFGKKHVAFLFALGPEQRISRPRTSSLCRISPLILILFLGICFASTALASDDPFRPSRYKISGFGTLGLVTSDSEQLGFYRDTFREDGVSDGELSFKADSLLGIQLNTEISNTLDAALQLVLRDRVDNPDDIDERSIEQAFIRYKLNPAFNVRMGRLPINIYMLADYRNVGFAYLWARPPTEFYGRIPIISFDGIDFNHSIRGDGGIFRFKLFGGSSEVVRAQPEGLEPWTFNISPFAGLNLTYETDRWSLQGGYANSRPDGISPSIQQFREQLLAVPPIAWPEAAQIADDFDIKGQDASYYSLAFLYDDNLWVIQTEIAYIESHLSIQPSELDSYLSIARRLGTITPYLLISVAEPSEEPVAVSAPLNPSLLPLQAGADQIYNSSRTEQKTVAIGSKWDLHPKTNLKLQYERTWVEGGAIYLWENVNSDGKDETVDTISLNLNFIF